MCNVLRNNEYYTLSWVSEHKRKGLFGRKKTEAIRHVFYFYVDERGEIHPTNQNYGHSVMLENMQMPTTLSATWTP